MSLRRCIFAGPSLAGYHPQVSVDFFAPASMGAIYKAYLRGYDVIGLVDGVFGDVPAVWHKEILYVMKQGVRVLGASSIGALRASELDRFGMIGIGLVYRLYRSGSIIEDDEVAVLHGPACVGFTPMTLAMIDIRIALRGLRRRYLISRNQEQAIADEMKCKHFSIRTLETLHATFWSATGRDLASLLSREAIPPFNSIKRRDAEKLVELVANGSFNTDIPRWDMERTEYWRRAMEEEVSLIPELEAWP